ncbi:MAG: aromatic ring-hydroxylating oxygenase subunit alpha [Chthoniobacterales bacterium]
MHRQTTSAVRKPKASPIGAKSLSQEYFVSSETFAKEQEKIFAKQWLLVGHQSQLKKSGDFFLAEVSPPPSHYGVTGPGPESLIVIRDQKSEIRGFHNVCRHRGTRLKEDPCGHASAIQCPYHAWTYGLDGRLIGAPHMEEVPGFDKADYPLHQVNLGVWEGFIFANLRDSEPLTAAARASLPTGEKSETRSSSLRQAARLRSEATPKGFASRAARQAKRGGYRSGDVYETLEEWFAPLNGKFSHWTMSILRPAKRIEYDVKANWKLIFENYSECYHCPGVHPQLQKVSPYDSAENDLREGPFLGGFMKINQGKSLTMSGNACALQIKREEEAEEKHQVFYYSIFPNMLLSMHPEYVMVHQLWPQSPDRTLIVCDWFLHPDAAVGDRGGVPFNPDDAIEFWDMTNKQDWHVCELSQQGIASRAYTPGPYSSRETIPAAWDRYYLHQIA